MYIQDATITVIGRAEHLVKVALLFRGIELPPDLGETWGYRDREAV